MNKLFLFFRVCTRSPVPQPPSSVSAPMPPAHPPPPHEDEPSSKKMKTEDNLIPEEEFLRRTKVQHCCNIIGVHLVGTMNIL